MRFHHQILCFMDEDGDTPDWIELYNPGADEVLLNNWSLD